MDAKTAVVVSRHPLWAKALCDVVSETGLEVRATAISIPEAISILHEHRPDLVIVEVERAESGVGDARLMAAARKANPRVKCIVVSSERDLDLLETAFAAGASAYCLTTAPADDFVTAIRQSFDRSIYFALPSEGQAERSAGPVRETPQRPLTAREAEILRLVAEGHSNADVARGLWVTDQTVKFHLRNIYRKLGLSNRTEAGRWAQANGLLDAVAPLDADAAESRRGRDAQTSSNHRPLRAVADADEDPSKPMHSAA